MDNSDLFEHLPPSTLRHHLRKTKHALSALETRHNRFEKALAALRNITTLSNQTLDCEQLFGNLLPKVTETLDCGFAAIYRIEKVEERFILMSNHNVAGSLAPPNMIEGNEFDWLSNILTKDQIPSIPECISASAFHSGFLGAYLSKIGVSTFLVCPILAGNLHYGVLILDWEPLRRTNGPEDAFLASFITQIGAAIERMNFYDTFHQVEKLSTLGEVISGIVHELNNPLTVVIGFAELLTQRDLDPKSNEMAQKVFKEAVRSKRIVDNLLTFAKKRISRETFVDIHSVIDKALELVSYELRVTNIKVKRNFDPLISSTLGDPYLLEQVFFNIITNAHQAMLEQGTGGELTITTEMEQKTIIIRFSDTGSGIHQDIQDKIFEPFFTTKTLSKGTGLGLSLAQKIIERHGGSIHYETEEGHGATFVITLPAITVPKGSANPERIPEKPSLSQPGSILIVDDEPIILDLLSEILKEDQHKITSTGDAATALGYISTFAYDCILCDLKMPGMSGKELLSKIQVIKPDMAKRLIFVTGDFLNEETNKFMIDSKIPIIKKPFVANEVCDLINQVMSQTTS